MSRLFLGFLKVFAKKLSPRRDAAEMTVTGNFIGWRKKLFLQKPVLSKNSLASFLFAAGVVNHRGRWKGYFERFFWQDTATVKAESVPKKSDNFS
jgi:hypothetical protein